MYDYIIIYIYDFTLYILITESADPLRSELHNVLNSFVISNNFLCIGRILLFYVVIKLQCEAEDSGLLGCELRHRASISPYPVDEGAVILQNVGNNSTNNTALHPTRPKSSKIPP